MDAIAAQLAALPPTVNPYLALNQVLHEQLIPQTDKSFLIIMRVCHGLIGTSTLLVLASLVFLLMGGSTWVYRWRDTPAGSLVVLNTSLVYLIFILLYTLITQGWIVAVEKCYFGGTIPIEITKILAVPGWVLFSFAFWVNAYDMACSAFARYSLRLTRFNANHLLFCFALVPILEFTQMAVFFHSASQLQKANGILAGLNDRLIAQPWSIGEAFALQPAWAGVLQAFVDKINVFVQEEQTAYGLLTADMLLNSAVVLPATLLQINILRKHANHGARAVEDYLHSGRHASHAKMLTARSEEMRHTVWSLVAESALVLLATISITGLTAWVASNLRSVLSGGTNIEAAYAIAFLTYGSIGIPVHLLALRRAIKVWQKKRIARAQAARSAVAQMQITTETMIEVDDGKDSDTRSVSSVDMADHFSIAIAAMRREKAGISDRARRTVFAGLHNRSDIRPDIVVLPEVGSEEPTVRFARTDSKEKDGLDSKSSHSIV